MPPRVLGFIDHTHPATAQLLDDAVVRDRLADELGGGSHHSTEFSFLAASSVLEFLPVRRGVANPQLIEQETENISPLLDSFVEGAADAVSRTRTRAQQHGMIGRARRL